MKNYVFNIIGDAKYKTFEARHVPDTSGYRVYINDVERYYGAILTKDDVKDKISYFQRLFVMEEITPPAINPETGKIKRHRRTKAEMAEVKRAKAALKEEQKRQREDKKNKHKKRKTNKHNKKTKNVSKKRRSKP